MLSLLRPPTARNQPISVRISISISIGVSIGSGGGISSGIGACISIRILSMNDSGSGVRSSTSSSSGGGSSSSCVLRLATSYHRWNSANVSS